MQPPSTPHQDTQSGFKTRSGERYYAIHNVDNMAPFFISLISNSDHWMFISSTGALTAGRVSPDTALLPYETVDKIYDSTSETGSTTLIRVTQNSQTYLWEPYKQNTQATFKLSRNLYKNLLGNKICFEEINHDLGLTFRCTWATSSEYGFVRKCEIENINNKPVNMQLLDGLQNILPANTPRHAQTNTSNLVDAYKWTEVDELTGLGLFTLYSGITDRAEPQESLKANTVFCLGLSDAQILLSSEQIKDFRHGVSPTQETHKRGIRGAYLAHADLNLAANSTQHWQLVADIEQSQAEVVALNRVLAKPHELAATIEDSIAHGSDELARILASGDAFQATGDEAVSVHHSANALFNILRGGIFDNHYSISSWDFRCTLEQINSPVYHRHQTMLAALPETLKADEMLNAVQKTGDAQLERLCFEYLPIRFGRRHGDPSRPWNLFNIKLFDKNGYRLLSYEGNWRDIFQNWEALLLSYPEFIESVIAKFVNASTVDGYNPYRITKEGIDWEEEEPDNPWSYIGYWGDHQIIYLLKLLELSKEFHPSLLAKLLHHPIFCYANVPYKIKPFAELVKDPKHTVQFDTELADVIHERVNSIGADGKLVVNASNEVYQVTLIEKLLVPLLSKLGNLVIDGGIWLNTQRPEWNDANNALVGHGLSMVTLNYLRRYVAFLTELFADNDDNVELSNEVGKWLQETSSALASVRAELGGKPIDASKRYTVLTKLGEAASRYRQTVYEQQTFSGKSKLAMNDVAKLLGNALAAIDHSIQSSRREDGMYHAYNLLTLQGNKAHIDTLYPMLEGQVAALSSGVIAPEEAADVVDALFKSEVYRPDQESFMLYPDRALPSFLEKNRVPTDRVGQIALLQTLFDADDDSLMVKDAAGNYRFSADFRNVNDLDAQLDGLTQNYATQVEQARAPLRALYEDVFNHKAFTGRSGGMFGFEGLGSIYWHMVSKLLLAVQENYLTAVDQLKDHSSTDKISASSSIQQRLGDLYYRVRHGIGFNKTAAEYGAFPMDPYSHTPKHNGAQQPGMTGQVKEEILTRFGELGVRVKNGIASFTPSLLLASEFTDSKKTLRYLDVDNQWQEINLPPNALAFTWCQVPIVYQLDNAQTPSLKITDANGQTLAVESLSLNESQSKAVFQRDNTVRKIHVVLNDKHTFKRS